MRFQIAVTALLAGCASAVASNLTSVLSSTVILPSSFKPPQVFKNTNLVRTLNFDKGYVRETVNVAIENAASTSQSEYYLPFSAELISRVGSLDVRDRKDETKPPFQADLVEFDPSSTTQYYRILFSPPVKPSEQQTLSISFSLLDALTPLPAKVEQNEKQYLVHSLSAYFLSAYPTLKQKLRLKFPTSDVPDYTILTNENSENKEDPQKQGSTFTYGPFGEVPAGVNEPLSVRYEFTKPVIVAKKYERDIEISHWGGNLATEERFWLENHAASLKSQFDRVKWASSQYYAPPTTAMKELQMPLRIGSMNPYFVDDIGNVSTSRFRSNKKEALLALKPRYPVFGDWKYSFKVGWDLNLRESLRKTSGNGYVLKVPFIEGPKGGEGISYEKVQVRVILPEGATNVKFETTAPLISNATSIYKTYMDTVGRTTLTLDAINLVDDIRDRELIVTYEYSWTSGLRKPLTFFAGAFGLFATIWVLGNLDVSIGRKTV